MALVVGTIRISGVPCVFIDSFYRDNRPVHCVQVKRRTTEIHSPEEIEIVAVNSVPTKENLIVASGIKKQTHTHIKRI